MENTLLKSAIEYSEKFNYPIIPCNPKDKKPLIKWKEYQERKSTIEEIQSWWGKWPNAMIGGVTGKISGDFVIDIDNMEGEENLLEYIPDTLQTPTSITPRGGKHLHFEHPEESITIGAALFPHVDYRGSGGFICLPPSENSEGKKYIWLDGLSLWEIPRVPLPSKLLEYIINKALSLSFIYRENVVNGNKWQQKQQNTTFYFKEGTRDQDLFHLSYQLKKSGTNEQMIRQVIETIALYGCSPPFDIKEAQVKVDSAIDRAMKKERHLTQDIREWVEATFGNFSATLMQQEQHLATSDEKKKSRIILGRLCEGDNAILERVEGKDGWFRKIQNQAEEMKWWEATGKEIKLVWPFGLENHFRALTKNIIVIAGSPDAGKTAFLLNFCLNNMTKHEIFYFTSEAAEEEIDDRLSGFGIPNYKEKFRLVKFFPRSRDFHDLIKPNNINIIDYLEMPEEPWKIGIFINKIHEKLDKGICLIALQKPISRDVARGGEVTLDRPKLYVSIGKDQDGDHILKIIKCKNWRERQKNPNGLSIKFQLVGGCNIRLTSEWSIPWEVIRK